MFYVLRVRPRPWPMRELMNAMLYVLRSGCPCRMVPANFAPYSTVYRWFLRLPDEGVFQTIKHHRLIHDREIPTERETSARWLSTDHSQAVSLRSI
jgi:putative transposase